MTRRGKKDFTSAVLADIAPVTPPTLEQQLTEDTTTPMGERAGTSKLADARMINLERIVIPEDRKQCFIKRESLQKLAEVVKTFGIAQPVTVEYDDAKDHYRLLTGIRRFLAAQEAGLTTIPCIIRRSQQESLEMQQLLELIQWDNVPILEEAEAIDELRKRFTLSQREIARRIGKPKTYINELLQVLRLPETIKTKLREGFSVPKAVLLRLAKLQNATEAQSLFEQVQEPTPPNPQPLESGASEPGHIEQQLKPVIRNRKKKNQFTFQSNDHRFSLKLSFRKHKISTTDIQQALQEVLGILPK